MSLPRIEFALAPVDPSPLQAVMLGLRDLNVSRIVELIGVPPSIVLAAERERERDRQGWQERMRHAIMRDLRRVDIAAQLEALALTLPRSRSRARRPYRKSRGQRIHERRRKAAERSQA